MTPELSIVGIGATETGGALEDDAVRLCVQASVAACEDAGIELSAIDAVLSEAHDMPEIFPDIMAALGLSPDVYTAHVGLIGSGAVATPLLARALVAAGMASTVLCVYGLNLSQTGGFGAFHEKDPYKANMEMPFGFFPQSVYMACMAQRYCHDFGVDPDLLGYVPLSAREWASLNPTAERRTPFTIDEYLAKPHLSEPLRALDCCLVSEGACAFIVTTADRAKDLRQPPVKVLGGARAVEPMTEHEFFGTRGDYRLPSRFSGPAAFANAGVGPSDIDLAYLYDCFSIIPVLQYESIGFCGAGEGLYAFESGSTRPGGRLPVNTHGGLMSHSYVPGINSVFESVLQLRGHADAGRQVDGAETALIGAWAAQEHTTLILQRS
jgi:acetyl-CoA acetyltransferase